MTGQRRMRARVCLRDDANDANDALGALFTRA